jgi:homogentisate 1,2-dioxygenase
VTHEPFHPLDFPAETLTADFRQGVVTPNQLVSCHLAGLRDAEQRGGSHCSYQIWAGHDVYMAAEPGSCATSLLMRLVVWTVQRWRPFKIPEDASDFVRGLFTICGAGRCDGFAAQACHCWAWTCVTELAVG